MSSLGPRHADSRRRLLVPLALSGIVAVALSFSIATASIPSASGEIFEIGRAHV